MKNQIKLEFPNNSCNESLARITAAAFAMELDPTLDCLSEIKTAVSEAVTNAIIHGYGDKPGTIVMECETDGLCVTYRILDQGCGIADISRAMEPLYTGAPDMERSGMGFTIMETFMDEIHVDSCPNRGTCVTLKKQIRGRGEVNDRE